MPVPLDPDGSDEKSAKTDRPVPDMDTQMLFGCAGFVATAIGTYALAVWPHFLWLDTHLTATLALGAGFGLLPAAMVGAYATRKYGLAAAGGFLGGAICGATFLYLRLQQVMAFRGIRDAPQPEYPFAWMWMLPSGWVLLTLLLIALLLRREEFLMEPPSKPRRAPAEGDPPPQT